MSIVAIPYSYCLLSLQTAIFLLYAHMTFLPCVCTEKERTSCLMSLLIRTRVLLVQGPTLMTSFNPNNFLGSPNSTLVEVILGVRASTCEFIQLKQTFQSITPKMREILSF